MSDDHRLFKATILGLIDRATHDIQASDIDKYLNGETTIHRLSLAYGAWARKDVTRVREFLRLSEDNAERVNEYIAKKMQANNQNINSRQSHKEVEDEALASIQPKPTL